MKKLLLSVIIIFLLCLPACAPPPAAQDFAALEIIGSMELKYARQFSVDYLSDGSALITINESGRFLLLPPGKDAPDDVDADIVLLHGLPQNIYLAATSAMCLFDALDALPLIAMSGIRAEGWYIENARLAMERGDIVYAGKYSAPDYELLLAQDCGLAIESTMIYHNPAVKEKLEDLGIPVLVERSSYEQHPLGRTEWIKLYGLLAGKEQLARELFDEQAAYLDGIDTEHSGKKVAFFYISSAGNAVARKGGDYVAKMIELAGGEYVFADDEADDSAAGSLNLEMESFYAASRDADIIIYNSSIDGEVRSLQELLSKSSLLADFKAVQNGDVWCTGKNMFQETTGFGRMIDEMSRIFSGAADNAADNAAAPEYFYKLR